MVENIRYTVWTHGTVSPKCISAVDVSLMFFSVSTVCTNDNSWFSLTYNLLYMNRGFNSENIKHKWNFTAIAYCQVKHRILRSLASLHYMKTESDNRIINTLCKRHPFLMGSLPKDFKGSCLQLESSSSLHIFVL